MLLTAALALALASQEPDSAARAVALTRVDALERSLGALRGAGAHFRRDLAKASGALVLARAREVRTGCATALAHGDSLAAILRARRYTSTRGEPDQQALLIELATLRRALVMCQREWNATTSVGADSVRAWGPFRLNGLENEMRVYEQRATRFRGYVAPPEGEGTR